MRAHRRFPIDDASQVGEARRAAQALATELAFDEESAGRLALAVTELGTNLFRHVGPGRHAALLIGVDETDGLGVQVLSRFGEEERAEMRGDDGMIAVDCAFCSKIFRIAA